MRGGVLRRSAVVDGDSQALQGLQGVGEVVAADSLSWLDGHLLLAVVLDVVG